MSKQAEWYVEIIERKSGDMVKRLGPYTASTSDRAENGVLRNLGDGYYTRARERKEGDTLLQESLSFERQLDEAKSALAEERNRADSVAEDFRKWYIEAMCARVALGDEPGDYSEEPLADRIHRLRSSVEALRAVADLARSTTRPSGYPDVRRSLMDIEEIARAALSQAQENTK